MKKPKIESKILHVRVECGKCLHRFNVSKYLEQKFMASQSDCELCGDHGDITFEASCPECEFSYDIEVDTW